MTEAWGDNKSWDDTPLHCILCDRMLPRQRWRELMKIPPFCRIDSLECHRLLAVRIGIPELF